MQPYHRRKGWSYVGDKLLYAVITYDESGWYVGEMWVKPPECYNEGCSNSMDVCPYESSKFAKYASESPTTCPRILLSGPAGSEIYQEMLAIVLAEDFEAKLMNVDSLLLPEGSPAREAESSKQGSRRERLSMLANELLRLNTHSSIRN
ncbi:Uncharacterized protein Rs2_04719 [Raphanus sativus]|uniref:Uncharacterized protein LOC108826279 n=1 Tax=Raphanus sativus TaxID=3726 RepID=A0A6J0L6I1_RAPSA|nr:uncharacterized protein LOC108826279 [Raphanus sativus]KAJ4910098.1 Uncharacterized protein Rs2_04719 [Raphanus sativus]